MQRSHSMCLERGRNGPRLEAVAAVVRGVVARVLVRAARHEHGAAGARRGGRDAAADTAAGSTAIASVTISIVVVRGVGIPEAQPVAPVAAGEAACRGGEITEQPSGREHPGP